MSTMASISRVVINARGEQRIRVGHPWIYRADVVDVQAAGGDAVAVIGPLCLAMFAGRTVNGFLASWSFSARLSADGDILRRYAIE